jgi:L-fuculose-phosphate aldolase
MNYKKLIVDSGLRMLHSGLTVATWGNISARCGDSGLVYLTPSAMNYEIITEDDIVVVKLDGTIVEGKRKPTIETEMHLAIYRQRPEINAVVHTHPIHSLVFAVLRQPIPPVIDEAAQIFGGEVPCTEYALPGTPELAANCVKALGKGYACLLANHGSVSVGPNMDHAFKVAAVLEMTAQVYELAQMVGSSMKRQPVTFSDKEISFMYDYAYHHYGQ